MVDFSAFISALDNQYIFFCQQRNGTLCYVSDSVSTLLGYSPQEWAGYTDYLTDYPGNGRIRFYIEQAFAGETPPIFEMEICAKDGAVHKLELSVKPYRDMNARVASVYVIARNVTTERRFQQQMVTSEMMLKEAQRLAKLGFLDVDHLTDTVVWSEEACKIFEVLPADYNGSFDDFIKRVFAEDRGKVADAYRDAVTNHRPFTVEYRILMPDGRIKHLHARGETRYDRYDNAVRTFGTIQDITERNALSYQFKEAQRLAKLGSWNHDLRTKRSLWSDEMYRICEKDPAEREVSYENIVNLIHPDDREAFRIAFRDAVEYRIPFEMQYRIVIPGSKKVKYLHSQAETTYDDSGKPLRIVGTTQDVTERVELQAENECKQMMLYQQSKMAQMGEMLSIIAHQWRQPLAHMNSMILELDSASARNRLDRKLLMDVLDRMEAVTSYLSQTIEDFRQYSHPQKEKEDFDVATLFDDALTLFQPMVSGHNIVIERKLCDACSVEGTCEIYAYKKELIQVLLVLLNNAKDAMEERKVAHPKIVVSCDLTDTSLLISVCDNGGGIDKKGIKHIFEPYFTTKHNKQGTGMGLYLARMIVENSMDGSLEAENIDKGAKFTIRLHLSDKTVK